jgi:hypothetical protein
MPESKTFGVGDLSLRDCWRICKAVWLYLVALMIVYGLGYLFAWGYEAGTESLFGPEPIGRIWVAIPKWGRYGIIFILALVVFRGLTSELLASVGKGIEGLGEWVGQASFKVRLGIVITLTIMVVPFLYAPFVGFGITMMVLTMLGAYEDLKREKIRQTEEEEL